MQKVSEMSTNPEETKLFTETKTTWRFNGRIKNEKKGTVWREIEEIENL